MCQAIKDGGRRCTGNLEKREAQQIADDDFVGAADTRRQRMCSPEGIKLVRATEGDRMADSLQAEQDARAEYCKANGGHRDDNGLDFEGNDVNGIAGRWNGRSSKEGLTALRNRLMEDEVDGFDLDSSYSETYVGLHEGRDYDRGGIYADSVAIDRGQNEGDRIVVNITTGYEPGTNDKADFRHNFLGGYGDGEVNQLSDVPDAGPERDTYFQEEADNANEALEYENGEDLAYDNVHCYLKEVSGLNSDADMDDVFDIRLGKPANYFTADDAEEMYNDAAKAAKDAQDAEDEEEDD